MPLFIQNEHELENEDEGPIPANTPNTGHLNNGHVIACGNRVLDIIEKHIKDVRDRKVMHDNTFKEMLRNARKMSHPAKPKPNRKSFPVSSSPPDVSPSISREVIELQNEGKQYTRNEHRISLPKTHSPKQNDVDLENNRERGMTFPSNLPNVESDEFLELPSPKESPKFERRRRSSPAQEVQQTEPINNSSEYEHSSRRSADRNANSPKANNVRFSNATRVSHISPEPTVRTSILKTLEENNFEISARSLNANDPIFEPVEECLCPTGSNFDNNNFIPSSNVHLQTEVMTTQKSPLKKQSSSTNQEFREGGPQGRKFNPSWSWKLDNDNNDEPSEDDSNEEELMAPSKPESNLTVTSTPTAVPSGSSIQSNRSFEITTRSNLKVNSDDNNSASGKVRVRKKRSETPAPVEPPPSSTPSHGTILEQAKEWLWHIAVAVILLLLLIAIIIYCLGMKKSGGEEGGDQVGSNYVVDPDRKFVVHNGPVA